MIKKVQLGLLISLFVIASLTLVVTIIIHKKRVYTNFEITAHRGACNENVENTMDAFKKAYELHSDFVEFDIRETKDEKLIVIHDENLKRITGYNKSVYDVSYNEIISNGGNMIPLFEDVLIYFKDKDIRLNVEIKPSDKKNVEDKVISLINKYNMMDKCFLASSSYGILENIKKIDNNIKTIYVIKNIPKNLLNYEKADIYSIYYKNLSKELVDSIHQEGKKIFVWTVNNKNELYQVIKYDIDNVITNDVTMVKKYLNN